MDWLILCYFGALASFSPCRSSPFDDIRIVHPKIFQTAGRRRRNINSNVYSSESSKLKMIEVGDWAVELNPESNLVVAPGLAAEWVSGNGDVTLKGLRQCDYKLGVVRGLEAASKAALSVCGEYVTGYLNVDGREFFIEPINRTAAAHKLYGLVRPKRFLPDPDFPKQSSGAEQWLFNLTEDTIDIGGGEIESIDIDNEDGSNSDFPRNLTGTPHLHRGWRREQLDDEELGYFYDTAWTVDSPITSAHRHKPLTDQPERWLEIALAVDHTVIAFHGADKVEQYVLALMNIVNAIYQDVSLEANVKLAVTRLLLYESRRQSVVRPGHAKKSLENVNAWNQRLHRSLAPGEARHDVAVWVTRSDIGGPSGYAPVAGACDPKRSCALNRDEGLSSAFIIAHEMAHILGLSHDGDKKHRNYCDKEASRSSVMAPLVAATFNKFFWSECSRKEFKEVVKKWSCLSNPPAGSGEIVLNATLQNAFSMDEQCRMEFGEGYALCRAFDIIEPCSHLWCGHVKSPLVCKTKKGSPLEGTQCGATKWCVNGYCQEVERKLGGRVPVILNSQDGGWGGWSPWGPCSRSCGTGVQFRTRRCDNPTPLHGGRECSGVSEKWQICNKHPCPEPLGDMRAQQCRRLPKLLSLAGSRQGNMTWLPYESDEGGKKCKLICVSQGGKELFESGENLIDGTPCSYENSDNICIQGVCQPLGCDGQLFSNMRTDLCGVCGGNNSNCSTLKTTFLRKLKREVTRVAVLPRMATKIKIQANVTMEGKSADVAFILKNRRRKRYSITVPNTGLRTEIIEGTKFYYEKTGSKHEIWAKGPVLAEMVVLVYAPIGEVEEGLSVSLVSEYVINRDAQNAPDRYKWILGGWGPCSASCGGGRRQQTVACWDNQQQNLVRRKQCSLITKPGLQTEKCNEFECNFQWIAGKWEPCSATCGLHGTQHRELYCVPQTVLVKIPFPNNGTTVKEPWRHMVDPNKCPGSTPASTRSCNKSPCSSHWTYGNWSQCSVSCGKGVSTRPTHCPPPEGELFYTCGEAPLDSQRVCYGATRHTSPSCKGRKRKPCTQDQSEYCSLGVLSKYCQLGGFRRLCCKSCSISRQISPVSI